MSNYIMDLSNMSSHSEELKRAYSNIARLEIENRILFKQMMDVERIQKPGDLTVVNLEEEIRVLEENNKSLSEMVYNLNELNGGIYTNEEELKREISQLKEKVQKLHISFIEIEKKKMVLEEEKSYLKFINLSMITMRLANFENVSLKCLHETVDKI